MTFEGLREKFEGDFADRIPDVDRGQVTVSSTRRNREGLNENVCQRKVEKI